jgi:hypothetical protein
MADEQPANPTVDDRIEQLLALTRGIPQLVGDNAVLTGQINSLATELQLIKDKINTIEKPDGQRSPSVSARESDRIRAGARAAAAQAARDAKRDYYITNNLEYISSDEDIPRLDPVRAPARRQDMSPPRPARRPDLNQEPEDDHVPAARRAFSRPSLSAHNGRHGALQPQAAMFATRPGGGCAAAQTEPLNTFSAKPPTISAEAIGYFNPDRQAPKTDSDNTYNSVSSWWKSIQRVATAYRGQHTESYTASVLMVL